MSQDKNRPQDGHIPATGFISAAEIAHRLKLRSVPNLQDELKKMGIDSKSICGKRVYKCESLDKLFWED